MASKPRRASDLPKAAVDALWHGNVIEEIFAETEEGKYDLLSMGSSYSVHSLRQMYSANVTSEIMERVRCPVMTARFRTE